MRFPLLHGPWPATLWTIGHSTLSADEFVGRLRAHRLEAIADVRRFPGSRRHPQFSTEAMPQGLGEAGNGYAWLPQLAGRRRPVPGTPTTWGSTPSSPGFASRWPPWTTCSATW